MAELEFVLNRTTTGRRSSGLASSSRAALVIPGVTSWPGVANDDVLRLGEFSFDRSTPTPKTSPIHRGSFCSVSFGLVKDRPKGNKAPRGNKGVTFKTSKAVAPWGMVVVPGTTASFILRAQHINQTSSRLSHLFSILAGTAFLQTHWNGVRGSEAVQSSVAAASSVRCCMLSAATSLRSSVRRGQIAFAAQTGECHLVAGMGMMAAVAFLQARLSKPPPSSVGSKLAAAEMSPHEATSRKLLAGGLAGAVSKTAVAPLERLTTIMMSDATSMGFLGSLRHMWRDGGFWGLYAGNAATMAKIVPQTAIQFGAFYSLKDLLGAGRKEGLSNLEHLLVGSAAGLLACSATYPLDTMRTQMSITGGLKGSLFSVGAQIVKNGGPGALYKGFTATLASDVLGSGLGFMNYEIGTKAYKRLTGRTTLTPPEKGLLGSMSAAATLTLLMPLEVIRRRLQVQGSCGRPVIYKGTLDAFVKILRTGGVGAFYRAALSNYLKVVPSVGAVYFLYDYFCEELGVAKK